MTGKIKGILFVSFFAIISVLISMIPIIKEFQLSPLVIGMVIGIIYANSFRSKMPDTWVSGLHFCTKWVLRTAIVFYGFRISFQNILEVGLSGILISFLMVSLTFILGYLAGVKLFKLDRDTSILISSGASICGAAAVLATESILKSPAHKTAIAVATVVLFGTIAMFLYPFLYRLGFIPMTDQEMGLYIGGSIHEVAHVVAAGNAISPDAGSNSVIVKMIRVMFLAPFLLIIGIWLSKSITSDSSEKAKIVIPWFAVLFIVMTGFNSLNLLGENVIQSINMIDNFALTMAMTALGMETSISKFKNVGVKPFYLAGLLFTWLLLGGFAITKLIA